MKKILNRLLLFTFTLVPVLCLTATAFDALVASITVIFSFALGVVAKALSPSIIPRNAKNIVILLFLALGVSISEMLFGSLFGDSLRFLPLCAVPTLLLLAQIDTDAPILKILTSSAVSVALFSALTLLTGIVRELLGTGKIFRLSVTDKFLNPAAIFSLPAGAIFIIALLIALLKNFATEDGDNA